MKTVLTVLTLALALDVGHAATDIDLTRAPKLNWNVQELASKNYVLTTRSGLPFRR